MITITVSIPRGAAPVTDGRRNRLGPTRPLLGGIDGWEKGMERDGPTRPLLGGSAGRFRPGLPGRSGWARRPRRSTRMKERRGAPAAAGWIRRAARRLAAADDAAHTPEASGNLSEITRKKSRKRPPRRLGAETECQRMVWHTRQRRRRRERVGRAAGGSAPARCPRVPCHPPRIEGEGHRQMEGKRWGGIAVVVNFCVCVCVCVRAFVPLFLDISVIWVSLKPKPAPCA